MFTSYAVLMKRGLRSDAVWTRSFAYKSSLKLIPLFLDTWALMRSQYWPRERIETYQGERLRAVIERARRIPYWEHVFSASSLDSAMSPQEMLSRIPITSKSQLNQHSVEYIADLSLKRKSDPDFTSGSTGKPFHFFQDWHASLRSFAVTERTFRATGKRFAIIYTRARPRNGFTFYRHTWFFLRGFTSIKHRMRDFLELGKRFKRGFILYGYTSWVVELARRLEQHAIDLPIRAVMVAGEHLMQSDRAYIERVMGAELFTLYASREVGFLGFECERHRMHLNEEWAYIEVVDSHGHALPKGREGRIIVTTFDNEIMPFIRYEVGDVGSISDSPCACGRTLYTLTFKGRTSELIEFEDGRVISLLDIAHAIGAYRDAIRQFQIIQNGALSFVFRVVPGPSFASHRDDLEQLMVRLLHHRVQVRWEFIEGIPEASSGKAVYFLRDFTYQL